MKMKRLPFFRWFTAACLAGLLMVLPQISTAENVPARETLDALAASQAPAFTPAEETPTPRDILEKVRQRHQGVSLCARFAQVSVLSGMGMEDQASGSACFQFPDKMRWMYEEPEKQIVVSDGKTLWIHRPADHQAMKGDAARVMGPGQGASFLSDPGVLAEHFTVSMADDAWVRKHGTPGTWALKLVPKKPRPEFAELYLLIARDTSRILGSVSFNNYGDWTRILFSDFSESPGLPPDTFEFTPPPGTDVASMDDSGPF